MNKTGKLIWVYSFNGVDGQGPFAGLLRDAAGNLYGTTEDGGTVKCNISVGCGTVFKLSKDGRKEKRLHSFTGGADGSVPEGLLIQDSAGNLYGTTIWGGINYGVVFKMDQTGREKVLYTFPFGADGGTPNGVITDSAGNLYGTTAYGGNFGCFWEGCGIIYKLDSSGTETVLYAFNGGGRRLDSIVPFDSR